MKAVILAAGRSFRMDPVPDKNMLLMCGKSLIQWQIELLRKAGWKEIILVGGKHNLKDFKALKNVQVVEQKNLDEGMKGGVLAVKRYFEDDEPILLVSGNDFVDEKLFKKMLESAKSDRLQKTLEGVIVGKKVTEYFPGGYMKTDRKGLLKEIVEKPKPGREPSDMVNLVVHLHYRPQLLFQYLKDAQSKKDDLYEVALSEWMGHGARFRVHPYSGFWQPVKYPWHVLKLLEFFIKRTRSSVPKKGKNVSIKGAVVFGKGVRLSDNASIVGPAYIGANSIVGNNVLIREAHFGQDSVVGFASEVARSYFGSSARLHNNYIGDSVIGNNVAFGGGTVTGNFRLDEKNVQVLVKGEKVDCGSSKCGIITGDNIRVGINTSFMPGVKIGSNSVVGPGIVVGEDVSDDAFVTGEWKLKKRPNKLKI
jgi:UDP-N-acetylglucosamine diphosphorylase / glucose-1-phosphate thymidylyltransferase / UDP-N-acetylgalactosamine diphosphorylase / glucosamine-1-phosphate N-acetyltransferase / galactosamine-1-phosphate N-acetyltransferase